MFDSLEVKVLYQPDKPTARHCHPQQLDHTPVGARQYS
jgi:hypothetical protein